MEQPLVRAVREGAVLHGQLVPLQAALQEGQPRGVERRAERRALRRRAAGGDRDPHPLDQAGRGAEDHPPGPPGGPGRFVTRHRTELVLKPNDDYGGHGIVLGWKVDDAAWAAALRTALDAPFIVQERLELPTESFPSLSDGRLVYDDRIVDTNPFVVSRTVHGRLPHPHLDRLAGQRHGRRRDHGADFWSKPDKFQVQLPSSKSRSSRVTLALGT